MITTTRATTSTVWEANHAKNPRRRVAGPLDEVEGAEGEDREQEVDDGEGRREVGEGDMPEHLPRLRGIVNH